jgi:uncharacterized protein (DUF2336 family)
VRHPLSKHLIARLHQRPAAPVRLMSRLLSMPPNVIKNVISTERVRTQLAPRAY